LSLQQGRVQPRDSLWALVLFGGMILATFIATIFIPLFFVWLSKHQKDRIGTYIKIAEEFKNKQ